MKVAAIVGSSGAGKTTLLAALIERYVQEGAVVAAIKHTHHPLNEENRGDTARFRAAGAEPVILAGSGEAVVFTAGGARRIAYRTPGDLLAYCSSEIVLIEGFKREEGWPSVTIHAGARPTAEELAANLDRIWRST